MLRRRNSQRNGISVGGTKGRYLWPLLQRTFDGTFRNLCLMATKTMSVIIYIFRLQEFAVKFLFHISKVCICLEPRCWTWR